VLLFVFLGKVNSYLFYFISFHIGGKIGNHPAWKTPDGVLATVLLTNNIARKVFGVSSESEESKINQNPLKFLTTSMAASRYAIEHSLHKKLSNPAAMIFIVMPLIYSESITDLDAVLKAYEDIVAKYSSYRELVLDSPIGFASVVRRHRDVIDKFGRFPNLVENDSDLKEGERLWLIENSTAGSSSTEL
jgi:uncharacterized protein (DUF924 family)